MKKTLYFILIAVVLSLTSCEKLHDWNQPKEPETKNSSVYLLGGEWWVRYYIDGEVIADYSPLFTYNTAADDGKEMWISDGGNFWTFTVKSACNVKNISFGSADTLISTADWEGSPYDIGILISNGKVIKNGGFSASGVVTDSIYFEIRFEDDDSPYETVYQGAGTRKTGFLEDEY